MKTNLITIALLQVILIFSKSAFSNTKKHLEVNLLTPEHLTKELVEKWNKGCNLLASHLIINKGYWSSGIADSSSCTEFEAIKQKSDKTTAKPKKDIKSKGEDKEKNSKENGKEEITQQRSQETYTFKTKTQKKKIKANYKLDITIKGQVPERSSDKNFAYILLDKTLGIWDGIKRQIFQEEVIDSRQIEVTLIRVLKNGKNHIYSTRTYEYSDKFWSYFELSGFAEMLAFDVLVDAPYQWDVSVMQHIKDKSPVASVDQKESSEKAPARKRNWAIKATSDIFDLELNKNLYLVKVFEKKNLVFVREGNPTEVSMLKVLSLDAISKSNLMDKYIKFNSDFEKPSSSLTDDIKLSFGHEPYSRYYFHKKFEYLLRKLKYLDLSFYFGGTSFGIGQILASNDDISYVGLRYASGVTENPELLGTYFNIDASLNKGVTKGLKFSFDLWPKSEKTTEDSTITMEAFRFQFGYSIDFLLPLLGAVEMTPTIGLWTYNVNALILGNDYNFEESFGPSVGIRFGYKLTIWDFLLSAYAKYTFGLSDESNISSSEYTADLGYNIRNIYKMRNYNPAVYGFVSFQEIDVGNKEENPVIDSFVAEGLVVGVGASVAWE